MSSKVWDRLEDAVEHHTLSKRSFVALMSIWTLLGFAVTWGGSLLTAGTKMGWGYGILLFIGMMMGSVMAGASEYLVISLTGYGLLTLFMGMLLGPTLAQYTHASLVHVLGTTGILCVGLTGIGVLYPESLESWGIYLFGGLLLLIVGMYSTAICAAFGMPVGFSYTWIDWIAIILFSAYLIYDMNRAMRINRTLLNSLRCATAAYLDILNIFLHLLNLNRDD